MSDSTPKTNVFQFKKLLSIIIKKWHDVSLQTDPQKCCLVELKFQCYAICYALITTVYLVKTE